MMGRGGKALDGAVSGASCLFACAALLACQANRSSESNAQPAATATVGRAMTVSELQAAFDADEKAWTGKKVKVEGVYFSMTTSSAGGKKTFTVSVANSKDDTNKTMACSLATQPPLLRQYTPVLVEGSVRKMFGASLDDCTMVQK